MQKPWIDLLFTDVNISYVIGRKTIDFSNISYAAFAGNFFSETKFAL